MKEIKNGYKVRIKINENKLLECDDKYSQAYTKILLNLEDGPRVNIKYMEDPNKI